MTKHSACLRLACLALLVALPACFLHRRHDVNLLVIVVDSLRSDALSQSLGAAHTPSLSALAKDGIAYSSCYAHSSATLPAHAAILTARTAQSSGVRNDVQPIDPSVPLLAEHLRQRGWQTFAAVSSPALVPPAVNQGLDRGCQSFSAPGGAPPSAAQVSAKLFAFMETAERGNPWFAYLDLSDPAASAEISGSNEVSARLLLDGAPIGTARTQGEDTWSVEVGLAPGKHTLEMRSDATFNLRRLDVLTEGARLVPTFDVGGLYTPLSRVVVTIENDQDTDLMCRIEARIRAVQSLADSRARYKEQVEAVDRAIGQIVEVLKASGQYDNTIIVVTGSHGEALGEHGITGHDVTLYDEVLRVPLILKPIEGDERRNQLARRQYDLVRHVDVAPTILDLLDEATLPGGEGFSLLEGGQRELAAESHPPEAPGTVVARRDDRYKLVYIALDDRFEMYDVKSDTLEMDNLFALQGQYRSRWQAEMRSVARNVPQTAHLRPGTGPTLDVRANEKAPAAARN